MYMRLAGRCRAAEVTESERQFMREFTAMMAAGLVVVLRVDGSDGVAETGAVTDAFVMRGRETVSDAFAKETVDAFAEATRDSRRAERNADAERREHYWGQAVQYLERGVQVRANKKITLLARREADRVRFSLKEGVGAFVGKPPWKIEWGGGASVHHPPQRLGHSAVFADCQ